MLSTKSLLQLQQRTEYVQHWPPVGQINTSLPLLRRPQIVFVPTSITVSHRHVNMGAHALLVTGLSFVNALRHTSVLCVSNTIGVVLLGPILARMGERASAPRLGLSVHVQRQHSMVVDVVTHLRSTAHRLPSLLAVNVPFKLRAPHHSNAAMAEFASQLLAFPTLAKTEALASRFRRHPSRAIAQ